MLASLVLLAGTVLGTSPNEPVTLRVGAALPAGRELQIGLSQLASALRSDSLIALSNDGRVVPRLAASWKFSPDDNELTFALRTNATFHDGRRVDAESVARLVAQELRQPVLLRAFPGLGGISSVSAADPRTIVVRSKAPRMLMLEELANVTLGRDGSSPGLGPYILDQVSDTGVTANAFDHHYLGRPAIDRVELRSFRSLRSAWAAMMRDEIDALYEVNRESVEFVEGEGRIRVYPFLRQYVANLLFNVDRPQFADPRIRRALSFLIDRQSIVNSVYRGKGRVADGPLWPDHWALRASAPRQRYDRAAGLELLRSLPIVDAGDRMPSRLRFTCLVVENFESQPFERLALVIQKQLYEVGVDVELRSVTVAEAIRLMVAGDFDAALFEYGGRSPSSLYGMWHSPSPALPPFVKTGYSAADRELDTMQMAATAEDLKRAVVSVYGKMSEDPPAIFIAWPEVARAVSTEFEVPIERGADPFGVNLRLWRRAGRETATP